MSGNGQLLQYANAVVLDKIRCALDAPVAFAVYAEYGIITEKPQPIKGIDIFDIRNNSLPITQSVRWYEH